MLRMTQNWRKKDDKQELTPQPVSNPRWGLISVRFSIIEGTDRKQVPPGRLGQRQCISGISFWPGWYLHNKGFGINKLKKTNHDYINFEWFFSRGICNCFSILIFLIFYVYLWNSLMWETASEIVPKQWLLNSQHVPYQALHHVVVWSLLNSSLKWKNSFWQNPLLKKFNPFFKSIWINPQ